MGTGYTITRKQDREPDRARARGAVTPRPAGHKDAREGRSPGSCVCKVPSHTLPQNVLTLRARGTVPDVQTGTLSLRAAVTCSRLRSWTLAAVRSGSWPRTLSEGPWERDQGHCGTAVCPIAAGARAQGGGEPAPGTWRRPSGTPLSPPPAVPFLSPREGHSGLSSDSCPAREAPLTFDLQRLSS